jgi:hypothetical protein
MDNTDRTRSTAFEIPDDVLPLLRRAADLGLELACDTGGDWNADTHARVLNAARTVDVFYLGTPSAFRVVELADNALRWLEPRTDRPTTLDALGKHFAALGEVRELINVRDRALRASGLPFDVEIRR